MRRRGICPAHSIARPSTGINPKKKDKEEKRKPDPSEPFCGLVFKIVADTNGELYYLRIYSGTLKPQSRPYNPGRDGKEMVSKIYHTEADPHQRTELPEAYAGDIVALIGMKESITGDTLCDIQHPILLERIQFAEAVVSRSIEPESSADKDKLMSVLNVLRKEDPTFTWNTGQGHRANADERHGHVASGDQAASHGARFPPENPRRSAARQLPRDDPQRQ